MVDNVLDRRSMLAGLASGTALALVAPVALAQSTDHVALPNFREPGARDDVAALERALATSRPIHLPAGGGSAADGAYLIGSGGEASNLVSGARLFGDGAGRTILRKPNPETGYIFFCDSGSADAANNLGNISLSALTLEGDVVRLGFAEHSHLMHVNGVTDLTLDRVEFKGFRGDGFYLGSSTRRDGERHNRRIVLRACRFDGVNSNNRNGISIIDGDGVTIQDCAFVNVTRRGDGTDRYPQTRAQLLDAGYGLAMPGAIDCEPDPNRFSVLRDIRIERCRFSGGGGAAVSLLLPPNNLVRAPLSGFVISNCVIERQRIGFSLFGYTGRDAAGQGAGYDVRYEGNEVRECDTPFIINGARGVRMTGNRFTDCPKPAELGYTDYNHDCLLLANRFLRLGYSRKGIDGLLIRYADGVILERNSFVDCGQADGSGGRAISFVAGEIRNFRLIGNRFESPTGRTTFAIAVSGAVLDRGSCEASGNIFTFATNRDFG